MLYQTVSEPQFVDAFANLGRNNQFSSWALDKLYVYYEDESEMIELDVIAICCDWSEYADMDALKEDFPEATCPDDVEGEFGVLLYDDKDGPFLVCQ